MAKVNTTYDIVEAIKAIEQELMESMIRNMDRHRLEEVKESKLWSQWQVEQLAALEEYKKRNAKKYKTVFEDINDQIDVLISMQRAAGNSAQEESILKAIKEGFKAKRVSKGISGEFFKMNDRKIDALIEATKNDFAKGEIAILRRAEDQYRQVIFNAQVYAATGATYEQAIDMATKDFLTAGINCIEYANGARHTLSDYADMALRTAQKRAYLTGEGEMRQEWGIPTVIMNKRTNPCPKCLPFVGKVLIDDIWSGGTAKDGNYPLMSKAIAKGLYHPRCKDSHTTYFEGISTPPDNKWSKEELEQIGANTKAESRLNYAKRQAEKYERLSEYSLDKDNKRKYKARATEWRRYGAGRDRFGIFSNNDKSNTKYYDYKGKSISEVEEEISNLEYEVGVIFDQNGNAISCQLGVEDEIRFTKHQLKLMKGNDVTHNHPLSTPPSPEDLYLLIDNKAKSFRTCGKNGVYVLEYSKDLESLPAFEVFSKEYDDYLEELKPKYIDAVKKGMEEEEALIKLGEEVWDELYNTYGIKPRFERR